MMEQERQPEPTARERRSLRVFALASFFNDMGSDMIYPVWPLFLTIVLKANMAALGFIDGLGEALVSISQAVSGYLSDRWRKRKVFIWLGYLFGGVSRLGYSVAPVWQHIIPFRVLDRTGKMRGAPRDAMVADLSINANRGRNFGLLRAMDNAGAVVGILVCLALVNFVGYRTLFAIAALPSLVSVILVLALIRDRPAAGVRIFKGLRLRDFDRNFRRYFQLNALFALGAFSYSFLLIVVQKTWVGFKIAGIQMTGIRTIPLLYLLFTVVAALLSLPFGKLSDRIGRKPVLFMAFAFWAAVCLGVLFLRGDLALILVFALYGLHKAALEPVQRTIVSELSPVALRASSLGGFQMVVGLCALPASLVAGLLWDKVGLFAPFAVALGLTAVASLLLVFVREKLPEEGRG
jgi:MFS family permease